MTKQVDMFSPVLLTCNLKINCLRLFPHATGEKGCISFVLWNVNMLHGFPTPRQMLGAGPSGPTGRENGAQGRGRRPMPWVERLTTRCGLKGRETVGPALEGRGWESSRGPSGRKDGMPFFPGRRPSASALG